MLDIADSVQVSIRMAELVHTDGRIGASPDTVLAAQATRDEALAAATLLLRALPRAVPRPPHEFSAVPARHVPVERFASTVYPSLGFRVLGAAKIWMVINYFYPYKDLMQEDWDRVLLTYLPRFTAAADSLEYALAVAEMYAHIHDSHGFVFSSVLSTYYGMAIPPCLVRMIEGQPVVTLLLDDSLCHSAGIELGDIVLAVDGETVEAKLSGLRRLLAASTPGALELDAAGRLVRGPDSSEAVLKLRKQGGQVTTVKTQRHARFYDMRRMTERMDSDTFRMLDKDIGYVDLDRLETAQVNAVFDEFKDTKAIIFDMRGYPHRTAWYVAPRLLEQPRAHAARFQRNVVSASALQLDDPELSGSMVAAFTQDVVKSKESTYRGLTVMLIDERTLSQAEHTGLFLYAANQTKFIGSNSAGANGDVTNFVIPGNIRLWFTGQAVRFADGRQLQRIGIVPDLEVKPTIKGIRKKRDEVLERALEYVKQQLKTQHTSRR